MARAANENVMLPGTFALSVPRAGTAVSAVARTVAMAPGAA